MNKISLISLTFIHCSFLKIFWCSPDLPGNSHTEYKNLKFLYRSPQRGRTDEADLTHEVDSMMNHMTNDSARHRYNISCDDMSLKSNQSFMCDKYYKYVFNTVSKLIQHHRANYRNVDLLQTNSLIVPHCAPSGRLWGCLCVSHAVFTTYTHLYL